MSILLLSERKSENPQITDNVCTKCYRRCSLLFYVSKKKRALKKINVLYFKKHVLKKVRYVTLTLPGCHIVERQFVYFRCMCAQAERN